MGGLVILGILLVAVISEQFQYEGGQEESYSYDINYYDTVDFNIEDYDSYEYSSDAVSKEKLEEEESSHGPARILTTRTDIQVDLGATFRLHCQVDK